MNFLRKMLKCKEKVENDKSFKELLIDDIIPMVEKMKDKERSHLQWLNDNSAPIDFIQTSRKYYMYYEQRLKEYQEYLKKL